jgi:hypothetical protein
VSAPERATTAPATVAVETVQVLAVEASPVAPWSLWISLDEYDLNPRYAALPEPWATAVHEVIVGVDATQCWECATPVGFLLDDDPPGGVYWRELWLARDADAAARGHTPVARLCAACAPGVPDKPAPRPAVGG